ncbi:MAG: hypothetical protein QM604_01340 [Microbacterium sp.]
MPREAVLITPFDSALKLGEQIADACERLGVHARLVAPTTVVAHGLTPTLVTATTSRPIEYLEWDELVRVAREADIVVPLLLGPRVHQLFRELHDVASTTPFPVLGAGYVGMVLNDETRGYLARSLADVIAVNSRTDLATFTAASAALGLPTDNLLLTGQPLLPAFDARPRTGPVRRVLLADQPSVPSASIERVTLYERLAAYARAHPDREVAIRPRMRRTDRSFHRMGYSPEDFLKNADLPTNLTIDFTPFVEQTAYTDLVVSLSSTAILEALAAGCRAAFISDFYGETYLNHKFARSGLLRTIEQLIADDIGTPDPEWLADVFPSGAHAPADLFARAMVEMIDAPARPHDAQWRHPYQQQRVAQARDAPALRATYLPGTRDRRASRAERALTTVLRPLPAPARGRVMGAVRRTSRWLRS